MLKTRMALSVAEHFQPVDAITISQLLAKWVLLADIVEQAMTLGPNQCVVWGLTVVGTDDRQDQPYFMLEVNLCDTGSAPAGVRVLMGQPGGAAQLIRRSSDSSHRIYLAGYAGKYSGMATEPHEAGKAIAEELMRPR